MFNELLVNSSLSTKGLLVSKDRKTTLKTRVISENKHQLRIDEEDTHPIKNERKFISMIKGFIENSNVVILQDYNKGVLTPKVIKEVIEISNLKGIPTIVDPKKENFLTYKNCTIFKPNLIEINTGMNLNIKSDNKEEIETASKKLRLLLKTQAVLLTLSSNGICINTKMKFVHTPSSKRNVIDVSGAGDTVISVAALCLAINLDYITLSVLSSLAGGIVCEEVGVVPIKKERLLVEAKNITI